MREIEFRAWLKESLLEKNGYYKYESYKEKIDKLGRMRKVHSIHLNKESIIISSAWGGNIGVYFDGVELMQWTGLRDNTRTKEYPKGKKIFEGDILKHTFEYDNNGEIFEREEILIVKYEKEWCQFILEKAYDKDGNYYSFCEVDLDYLEVIGNIYENPELLTL